MKQLILGTIALVAALALFSLCVYSLTTSLKREVSKERDKYKVEIGQKIILDKDTLTIIDYSSIMETFTLSNRKEVDASIVFNKNK